MSKTQSTVIEHDPEPTVAHLQLAEMHPTLSFRAPGSSSGDDDLVTGEFDSMEAPPLPSEVATVRARLPELAREERITLTPREPRAISCGSGLIVVHELGAGGVQVDYEEGAVDVMLRVDDVVKLCDGDLFGAGQCWFRYEAGVHGGAPRIQLLDEDGDAMVSVSVGGGLLSIGSELGDFVLPAESGLEATQLRLRLRDGTLVLENLAESSHTWLVVPSGGRLPLDSTVAAGERLLRLGSSTPEGRRELGCRRTNRSRRSPSSERITMSMTVRS